MSDDILVALLRGINVGPNKRVAMADLRALVEGLGAGSVRTLLNSGNVVFSAAALKPKEAAARLEKALETELGVSARVVVMTAKELAEVVEANPLVEMADNASRLLVGILADPADKEKIVPVARQDWGKERIALAAARGQETGAARAVYMWMPNGVIESRLNQAVGKALGDGVTARNWATMLKLKKMAEGSAG
jgi:uncharacterized protein (DUF1697 family)